MTSQQQHYKNTDNARTYQSGVPYNEIINEMESEPEILPEWEKPTPFNNTLLSVLSVDDSMIPEKLRPWLMDIAYRMKCPLDFIAAGSIVMLSALIGTRLAIKPKQRDPWTITPNLWGAIIGGPSTMKTPSLGEIFKPLTRLIKAARVDYENAIAQYERAVTDYEVQKKAYTAQQQEKHKRGKIENPISYPEAPIKPKERRYMVNDATIEKLADLLNENPTGVLQFRDELTGMLSAWDKTGHEQDRAFYLEGWNGNGSMTIDRITRGTTHVKNVCISLIGGIQQSKLLPYLVGALGVDNDGLVQRFQLAVYPDKPVWAYVDQYPDTRARNTAFDLIKQIADADFSAIAYQADEYDPFPYTRFDSDAQVIFREWLIDWETNVLPNETGLLLEHFTKYRSLIPSLALIFHVVNCVDKPAPTDATQKHFVSADAIRMALKWSEYLMSHARRIYGLLDTLSIESAKSLLQHIKAGHLNDEFKARDVQRKQWANLTTLETVESALGELVERHWLKEVQPPAPPVGRPPAPHYLINPIIIQKH